MQTSWKKLLRNFAIEVVVYGILVVVYFLVVLRYLGEPLIRLFQENLVVYGFISLLLIVAQGIVLEMITAFLIERLGLERLE
jgi:hypothetical protein